MALRCFSQSLSKNLDNSCVLRQSLMTSASLTTSSSSSASSASQIHATNLTFSIPQRSNSSSLSVSGMQGLLPLVRHFSLDQKSLSTQEDSVTTTDNDFSIIEDSSSSSSSAASAASLIRAQVDEVMTTLPLTERLFAVVQIDGKQYRVSQDDVLTVEDWLPSEMGERIRLEKVLIVGGREFSLIGRPLLRRSQVSVEATVIEKSLTATDVIRRFRQRSRFKKTWLTRKPITYLRINSIRLLSPD